MDFTSKTLILQSLYFHIRSWIIWKREDAHASHYRSINMTRRKNIMRQNNHSSRWLCWISLKKAEPTNRTVGRDVCRQYWQQQHDTDKNSTCSIFLFMVQCCRVQRCWKMGSSWRLLSSVLFCTYSALVIKLSWMHLLIQFLYTLVNNFHLLTHVI